MSGMKSGIPMIGLKDSMMLVLVSELSLRSYENGQPSEGLHFETLRWIIHLRHLGLAEPAKKLVWSGADPELRPDGDVRSYHAENQEEMERLVEQTWEPIPPEAIKA